MNQRKGFWISHTVPSGEPWYVVWPRALAILLALAAIPGALVWWEWYKFTDCQAVGHSILYCVGKIILG